MRIAILTSGIMPVPAIKGGAVENLIDFYLEYNNQQKLHDITVYSVWHPDVEIHSAQKSKVNHYKYIKMDGWWIKVKKSFYKKTHREGYYHYSIEYFLHKAIKKIRHKHFDIIIVENRPGFILSLPKNKDTKYILHLHNDFLHIDLPHAKEIYKEYDRIISVSDFIKNRVNQLEFDNPKSITVYNAVDVQLFYDAKAINRGKIGFTKDDFIVVYSGRLNEEKGILQLIQAMKLLYHIPNIKLLVIGASNYGKDANPTHFINQLEKEAESIKNRIVFTGFVNYKDVPSYLKIADIAVVPSMWEEPFGLTVIEAMAAGLPLITTRSGGIPEICEGVATIVEKENIVNNLATAIQDFYVHPKKREETKKSSLTHSNYYDKQRYSEDFFKALEKI